MDEVVLKLIEKGKTISTMESCTGGAVASAITDIPGASEVLKFSAVTYSNEFKIKMGVSEDTINKYSVYSQNTADEMSKSISEFAGSDYGVGITGKINRSDKRNMAGDDSTIYFSIYDRNNNIYYRKVLKAITGTRKDNKLFIIDNIIAVLKEII